jgi:hypothetical protein
MAAAAAARHHDAAARHDERDVVSSRDEGERPPFNERTHTRVRIKVYECPVGLSSDVCSAACYLCGCKHRQR